MTLAVMCDGDPASLKAIGWASFPGHLMQQHDGAQLILLHAWEKESAPRVAISRENTMKAAVVVDEQTAPHCLPPTIVLQKSLETITESKVTRDTLNYKLETVALSVAPVSATEPTTTPVGQQRNNHSKSSPHTKKEADTTPSPPPPPVAPSTQMELEAAAKQAAEEAIQSRANAVAEYALERLSHHHAEALVLGSGNSMAGKGVMVGHVSKAVLSTLRHTYPLWFIKTNGCTMRMNTAIVRYVVVLVLRSGGEESLAKDSLVVQYALARRRKNSSDTVSVVLVVEYNTPPEEVERYLQAIETLLKEVTPTTESETNDQHSEEAVLAAATAGNSADPSVSHGIVAENDTATALPNRESVIKLEEEGEEVLPTVDGHEDAAEVQDQQQWPGVSVCQLKPTKQVAEPTVINIPGQVVKFLQRYKTDVVVSPSTLPEELHLSLLAMSKQHNLVVPSTGANPRFHASMTTLATAAVEAGERNAETPAAVTECRE